LVVKARILGTERQNPNVVVAKHNVVEIQFKHVVEASGLMGSIVQVGVRGGHVKMPVLQIVAVDLPHVRVKLAKIVVEIPGRGKKIAQLQPTHLCQQRHREIVIRQLPRIVIGTENRDIKDVMPRVSGERVKRKIRVQGSVWLMLRVAVRWVEEARGGIVLAECVVVEHCPQIRQFQL